VRAEEGRQKDGISGEDAPEIMDLRAATKYLHVCRDSVYKAIYTRQLPAFRLGSRWRFHKALLDRWIHERSNEPKRPASGDGRGRAGSSSERPAGEGDPS
jgi:excisionase family DNA binding protein